MKRRKTLPKEISAKDAELEYSDLLGKNLSQVDPDIDLIIGFEEGRQKDKLILIPSESISPRAVRDALGSVFTNLYAEGYPPLRMTKDEEEMLLDFKHQLTYYRRYSDRRFYKGTEYVNFVEALAQRRAAECFATDKDPQNPVKISPDEIFVNVQPLSGAAANNAVYEAFVEPGETVMGMALPHGGHLTHGSQFNRSGKRYHIVSYEVSRETERLDYEAVGPSGRGKEEFRYKEEGGEEKKTPLYEEYLKLGAKFVSFAGYKMPLSYTSIGEEHRAVRETAGLFDVAHMGILEISYRPRLS